MFWLVDVARAASVAGMNVPWVGGGFSGPNEPGALGVIAMPSQAAFAAAPEIALDLGLVGSRVSMDITALGAVSDTAPQLQPTLMAAVPFANGRVAIGAAAYAPYVRSGESDPDGPFRLYSISSTIQFLEADLVVAVRPVQWLSVGPTLRVGQLTLASTYAIDTGAMLNASLQPETPLPFGEPLLEGNQAVTGINDLTASWALAASVAHPDGHTLNVAYRPAWRTGGAGSLALVPSNDLNARIAGEVDLTLVLPASLDLAGRVSLGALSLAPEVQWVGWGRTGQLVYDVHGLQVESSDPLLNGILEDVGLSESALIASQEGVRPDDLDWRDVLNLGLSGSYALRPTIGLRAGLWYAPYAVQSRSVNPGNLDFAAWNVRVGADLRPRKDLRAALSLDVIPPSVRTITDSKYDLIAPGAPDDALPSGNGRYSLALVRAGLTVVYSFRGGASAHPSGYF